MSFNLSPASDYAIMSESEAAAVIWRFTPEMISDAIESSLAAKTDNCTAPIYNVVNAMEYGYKSSLVDCPTYSAETMDARKDSYLQVIYQLCKYHNCTFVANPENIDPYTVASILFNFFVTSYGKGIVLFLSNYILSQKDAIYEALELENKNETSPYCKKRFKNLPVMAAIVSNINFVVASICTYDIDLSTYLSYIYVDYDKPTGDYIASILEDNGDFFKNFIVVTINALNPIILTELKFALSAIDDPASHTIS